MASAALLLSSIFWLLPATAQETIALQETTCAGDRDGKALNCTAGEFTVNAVVQEANGDKPTCVIGGSADLDVVVNMEGTNTDRNDVGFFVGEAGNDPKLTGGKCSVATFPTSPLPWKDNDGDLCGDFAGGGTASPLIRNIKVACAFGTEPGSPTYGQLLLPYVLTYWQNNGNVCTGPAVVTVGNAAKCNAGVGTVSGVTLTGYVDVTKQTLPNDGQTVFNFTTSGTAPFDQAQDGEFQLLSGQTRRIETLVDTTTRTITITESSTTGWSDTASISCEDYQGNSTAGFVTIDGANRTFTAQLDFSHPAVACTITNTQGVPLTLVKNWENARVGDAVTVLASGDVQASLDSVAGAANDTDSAAPVLVNAGNVITISESFTEGSAGNYTATLACTGNTNPLVGTVLTVHPADTAITCTKTNARKSARLTLAKSWANAVVGDAVTVSSAGAVNNATLEASAETATETDTGLPVTVFAGEVLTISESFNVGASENYSSSLQCTGNTTALAGNQLTINASDTAIICTQTNARTPVTLTLRKTWTNANVGDTVTVSATGAGNNAQLVSTADTAGETDTGAPVDVFAGEQLTIAEAFTTGSADNYTAILACTGNTTPVADNILSITAGDSAIVCTQTNTRLGATLTLRKTWVNAAIGNAVTVSATGAANNPTLASVAGMPNETDTGEPANVFAGEQITIDEAFTVGQSQAYTTALACTGNSNPLVGKALTVGAADSAIVCTQTNTRRGATLTLRNSWVNAVVGDAVSVSATGAANNPTLVSVAATAVETDTGEPANVFAGELITIGQSFTVGQAQAYVTTLACTGNNLPLVDKLLTVDGSDSAIVCTQTNTRLLFPQLSLAKTASPATFTAGEPGSYTITVANTGEAPTSAPITVSDNLQAGVTLTSASGANWSCTGSSNLSCSFTGTLAPGSSAVLTLNVAVGNDAVSGNNSASVSGAGDSTCPTAGRCTGTVTVPVIYTGLALQIVKTASPVRISAGSLVLYTLTVSNVVDYPVTGVNILDTPPNGLAYVAGSGRINDANAANDSVTGSRPINFGGIDVAPGQTIRIQYLLRAGAALAAGEYINVASAYRREVLISNVASSTVYTQSGGDPLVEQTRILGKVFDDRNGDGWQDAGERGIPGVRLASVDGVVTETDAYGRYHIEGLELANQERGQNFIMKLDLSSMPRGTVVTTRNPLLRRLTPAIPVRFDFGVRMPPTPTIALKFVDEQLGGIEFAPGATGDIPSGELDQMVAKIRSHPSGEIFIDSESGASPLAFERAAQVRDQLLERLTPEERDNFTITLRLQSDDGSAGELAVGDVIKLGEVLFDTDQHSIRPEYGALLDGIAARIESVGAGRITVVGRADLRGSAEYNQALGLRRANSVYEYIARRLSPAARDRLSVEVEGAAVAPGAGQ